MGYSPWGRKESDTTERLHFHFGEGKLYSLAKKTEILGPGSFTSGV